MGFLKKLKPTSNASRNITVRPKLFSYTSTPSKLLLGIASKTGRSAHGRSICATKGAAATRQVVRRINYLIRSKTLLFIAQLALTFRRRQLLALTFCLDGSVSLLQVNEGVRLFAFTFAAFRAKPSFKAYFTPLYSLIHFLKNTTRVSLLEAVPSKGAVYVRSSGSYATLISINMFTHTAIFRLPSNVTKAFSIYALVLLGSAGFKENRRFRNTKAGF